MVLYQLYESRRWYGLKVGLSYGMDRIFHGRRNCLSCDGRVLPELSLRGRDR